LNAALLVAGTHSDAGKSVVVAGICRWLAREGVKVAPFKAQNMALNSFVTREGAEIGRAQAAQAAAAKVEPEAAMNPVLLKPSAERTTQVVVRGKPWATASARSYGGMKGELLPIVLESLEDLRSRFDVVVCEGAGARRDQPQEERPRQHGPRPRAALPVLLVGDIDRGGLFASLYGTLALLSPEDQAHIVGFLVNKFRGDPAVLEPGLEQMTALTGRPFFGTLPFVRGFGIDGEDSLALDAPRAASRRSAGTSCASPWRGSGASATSRTSTPSPTSRASPSGSPSLRGADRGRPRRHPRHQGDRGGPPAPPLPRPGPGLRRTRAARPADARHLRRLPDARREDLGRRGERHPGGSGPRPPARRDRLRAGEGPRPARGLAPGFADAPVSGYEIHHGRTTLRDGTPLFATQGGTEGCHVGATLGTSWHGVLESDGFRRALLSWIAAERGLDWRPGEEPFTAAREAQLEKLGDLIAENVDREALLRTLEIGPPAKLPVVNGRLLPVGARQTAEASPTNGQAPTPEPVAFAATSADDQRGMG
jgi:adenosylcobyric acid synthase